MTTETAAAAVTSKADVGTSVQDPVKLQALQDIYDAVEKDPDRYAGTSTDGISKITVYLVGGAAPSRSAVASVLRHAETAGIQTEVQYRKHSLRELTTLKDSIPDVEPFTSLGDDLLSFGVNTRDNSVRVGVADVRPDLVNKVRTTFGDKITLEQGVRAVPATGRFNNNPNYLGGNRLRNANFRGCTGGFSILNAHGQRYALTAGHCFGLGERISLEGSNNFFGTVQFAHYNDAVRIDMELVGVDVYRGGIWIGPVEGDLESRPVRSARNSCRGCEIDFDGSFTGQARGHLESEGNSTDCIRFDDGALACHVVRVRGANGGAVCTHGDSGGPVFAFDGQGGVIAVGMIEAVAVNPDGTPNRNVCWYTRIVPILAHWTSTIYTVY